MTPMRKLMPVVIGAFLLVACNEDESTQEFVYTKDRRTDLCFAWGHAGNGRVVMASVPCTPAVEKLIVR